MTVCISIRFALLAKRNTVPHRVQAPAAPSCLVDCSALLQAIFSPRAAAGHLLCAHCHGVQCCDSTAKIPSLPGIFLTPWFFNKCTAFLPWSESPQEYKRKFSVFYKVIHKPRTLISTHFYTNCFRTLLIYLDF